MKLPVSFYIIFRRGGAIAAVSPPSPPMFQTCRQDHAGMFPCDWFRKMHLTAGSFTFHRSNKDGSHNAGPVLSQYAPKRRDYFVSK